MRLTSERVLRALSRFDSAGVDDIALALNAHPRTTWHHLQRLVDAGFASREGERGHVARYQVTEAGRRQLSKAA